MSKDPSFSDSQGDRYEVFTCSKNGAAYAHAGSVSAYDPEHALQMARDVYGRRPPILGMWVVKSSGIYATVPEDRESFFDPAEHKMFRHVKFYNVPVPEKSGGKG